MTSSLPTTTHAAGTLRGLTVDATTLIGRPVIGLVSAISEVQGRTLLRVGGFTDVPAENVTGIWTRVATSNGIVMKLQPAKVVA